MKKVISVITCGLLAACACDENQWEEVDNITFDETVYEQPAPVIVADPVTVNPAPVVVRQEPVFIPAPTPVYDYPYTEVQMQPQPYYQPSYQPSCGCMQQPSCGCQAMPMPMPAPQPKVTKTKKIITTTTTIEEPCGKPVCEPVVTTHEEIIPEDVSYNNGYVPMSAPSYAPAPRADMVEVTVESNPYRSEVVGMKSSSSKVDASVAAKYSPETYVVVATRATNRMLQDTAALYDNGNSSTLFIKDTKLMSSDLPYGSHRLKGATKDVISGSNTFDVVNNINDANYIVDTYADWYVAPNNTMPALQYKMVLWDRNGRKINEWVEIIRQVQD